MILCLRKPEFLLCKEGGTTIAWGKERKIPEVLNCYEHKHDFLKHANSAEHP